MKKKLQILIVFAFVFIGLSANAQWAGQNSGTTDSLDGVFCIDANTCYTSGATQYHQIALKTTDGGVNWNNLSPRFAFSFFFTDANNGYGSGYDTI